MRAIAVPDYLLVKHQLYWDTIPRADAAICRASERAFG